MTAQLIDLLARPACCGELGDQALERLAHLEQLGGAVVAEHGGAGAATGFELDEAFVGERLQGFAHGVSAHAEDLGELILEDPITLREHPGDDLASDLAAHGLRSGWCVVPTGGLRRSIAGDSCLGCHHGVDVLPFSLLRPWS